jgi:hypothetical protein
MIRHILQYITLLGYCRLFFPLYFDKIKAEYTENISELDLHKQNKYENETECLEGNLLMPSKIVTIETDQLFLGTYSIGLNQINVVYIYIHNICVCICIHVYLYLCIHICIYFHTYTFIIFYVFVYAYICIHIYLCILKGVYMYIFMDTNLYIHKCSFLYPHH